MMAVPSMLMVAPKGIPKDATELSTPIGWVTLRRVTGMVAFDEAVENANSCAGRILRMKVAGFMNHLCEGGDDKVVSP